MRTLQGSTKLKEQFWIALAGHEVKRTGTCKCNPCLSAINQKTSIAVLFCFVRYLFCTTWRRSNYPDRFKASYGSFVTAEIFRSEHLIKLNCPTTSFNT